MGYFLKPFVTRSPWSSLLDLWPGFIWIWYSVILLIFSAILPFYCQYLPSLGSPQLILNSQCYSIKKAKDLSFFLVFIPLPIPLPLSSFPSGSKELLPALACQAMLAFVKTLWSALGLQVFVTSCALRSSHRHSGFLHAQPASFCFKSKALSIILLFSFSHPSVSDLFRYPTSRLSIPQYIFATPPKWV